jgi:hypothetical protein
LQFEKTEKLKRIEKLEGIISGIQGAVDELNNEYQNLIDEINATKGKKLQIDKDIEDLHQKKARAQAQYTK